MQGKRKVGFKAGRRPWILATARSGRPTLCAYVAEHLGDPEGVVVLDETDIPKQGCHLNPGDASNYGERDLIRSALGQMDLARDDFQDAYCRLQRTETSSGMDWIRSLTPDITAEAICD
ncbi:MAG: hypothetical protein OXC13_13305 [Caldilineaceae bacterium]|nr:hypothetical protein [Caldilineaceae bacterium]